MRRFTLLGLALFLLLMARTVISRADPDRDAQMERITALIRQLGHPRFPKREEASRELIALGEPALAPLSKAAVEDRDSEVRRRSKQIMEAILPTKRKSKALGMELVLIDAGDFQMGSPPGETGRRVDETQHRVRLTRPYYLGAHEVTQEEYEKVMKTNPSWFAPTGEGKNKVAALATKSLPVEGVSWYDAIEFCNRLSQLDGFEPCYKLTDIKREKEQIVSARVTLQRGSGYRLPTEAEWEHGCRGPALTPFHYGAATRSGMANLKAAQIASGYGTAPAFNELGRTCRVGTYPPNHWGLHDMHGNVAEWCEDWYDRDYYANSPKSDPRGPTTGQHRVLRGGSWLVTDASARSASRFYHAPDEKKYYTGFRVARQP